MVHGHSAVAKPEDLGVDDVGRHDRVRVAELLEDVGSVRVALSGMRLSCGQVTVDK